MNVSEIVIFIIYLCCMLGIGLFFFVKTKNDGEKSYFLGNREMGPWVAALSTGASDMSAWVLMGLPTSIYALGLGQVWISVGLATGYTLSWIFQAPRLRKFSVVAGDSITIPQYLSNRFLSRGKALQIICAIVFLLAYTVYAASSIKACGTLFNTVTGMDATWAMVLAAVIIVGYTFLGGFNAVCWTDFFQGMLILAAMLAAPIFALFMYDSTFAAQSLSTSPDFWNPFTSWQDIVSGFAWGLGYFGMPHIIIRFMSIKSQKDLKKSSKIGISWTILVVIFAALIGIAGRLFVGFNDATAENSTVFIEMVRMIFPGIISGILLSAVLAASMSTADSQLLAAASAFASDVYKPIIRKEHASNKEMLWISRFVVLIIAGIAFVLASSPNAGSIMDIVSNAWGVFGASFGPAIMLSLFWRRFNIQGAIAGIVTGAVVDIGWYLFLSGTGVYELAPGFIASFIVAIIVAKCTKEPTEAVEKLYDKAVAYED